MRFRLLITPVVLLAAVLVACGQDPKPDVKAGAEAKIRVETRGPVHEAFAQPFAKDAKQNKLVAKQPPAPIAEEPPDQRPAGDNVQWLPGYWSWDLEKKDFVWVSGVWRNIPDNRRWVPGHWTGMADGWVYVNGHWAAEAEQDLQIVPQPPTSRETFQIGNPPDNSSFYIPGTWFYTNAGWQWRDGYWAATRPGYTWVPSQYYWTPQGYAFTNGYWDYAPMNRGMLFAPVSFTDPSIFNSGYMYRPTYALGTSGLLDSLFVNSGFGQYFFGNYFGQQSTGLGFTPWLSLAAQGFDPLYSFMRFSGANQATTGGLTLANLQSNLDARLAGRMALPPRTLNEALQVNAAAAATGNQRAAARTAVLLAPLSEYATRTGQTITLTPVTPQQRQTYSADIQRYINRSLEMGRSSSGYRGPNLQTQGNAGVKVKGNTNPQGQAPNPNITIPGIRGQGNIQVTPGGGIQINPGAGNKNKDKDKNKK